MTIGIFLFSASLLLLEITLTRLSSVILSYHHVFLVVSISMLGLGIGGLSAFYLTTPPHPPDNPPISPFSKGGYRGILKGRKGGFSGERYLLLSCALFIISIPVSIILMSQIPYTPNIFFYAFLMFIPFFFAGILLSIIFRLYPEYSSKLYAADIAGAAAGVALAMILLKMTSGTNSALFSAIIASMAMLLFSAKFPRLSNDLPLSPDNPPASPFSKGGLRGILLPFSLATITLVLFIANLYIPFAKEVPVGDDPVKDMYRIISDPEKGGGIIETRWSAFGRTDLVKHSRNDDFMTLFVDGTAGTPMYRFNGDIMNPDGVVKEMPKTFPGYFPFLFLNENEKGNTLIIGSGGGRDVLIALMAGIKDITAVEINRELVDIVKDHSNFNGGIYTKYKNVRVVIDEGRSFLRRSDQKYNSIILTLPVTKSSRSIEGYALTESFLLTTESISDYLEHLKDDGELIVLVHNKNMALRLVSLALDALKKMGIDNPAAMRRIYLFGENLPLFVLKKRPFTEDEISLRAAEMRRLGFDEGMVFMPYNKINSQDSLNRALALIADGQVAMDRVIKASDKDMSPATDDSPFFYKFEKGLPENIISLLWFAVILSIIITLLPFMLGLKSQINLSTFKPALLFILLGAGFMILEVSFIQRFILFVGAPVISLSVFLITLFIGMGIGSLYSSRFEACSAPPLNSPLSKGEHRGVEGISIDSKIALYAFLISIAVFIYTLLLPYLRFFIGYGLVTRILITAILLLPLGFLLGIPFPSGIRALKQGNKESLIPWMWGINGAASVLGSALAVAIAIKIGFTAAGLISAGCYLIIGLLYSRDIFS
ncbi:MAG: hypothetical protein HZA06_04580 [Nitrospirae bacterium]|nr:hypothetical protein [Nitrospirota bacterium]